MNHPAKPAESPSNWSQRFATRTRQMRRSAVRELLKLTADPNIISFGGGLPAAELFPLEEIKHAFHEVLRRESGRAFQYRETEGVPDLRDWIAARYSGPSMRITRENVVITTGGQQALDLIGRVLLDPNDVALVENPTYLALLSAWRPLGVQFRAVPSDADGMQVHTLQNESLPAPKLLYITPNFQNPQGTTLSTSRRHDLIRLAGRWNIGIVEDDPYGELRYDGEAEPSLLQLEGQAAGAKGDSFNVIHVGTFSKVLVPGLRVGWLVAPEEVVEKIVHAKQAADLHTSSLGQHLILELVRAQVLERQIPLLRQAYRERRDRMLAALANYFPPEARWTRPAGGMFLMVTLPPELDATALLAEALRRQVAFVPGEEFHLDGHGRNTLRLNFSNATPDRIEEGIRRLGQALAGLSKP